MTARDTNEIVTFGVCKCGQCDLDLCLFSRRPVHFRGRISVGRSSWWIENLSGQPLVVSQTYGGGSLGVAQPGESLPISRATATVAPYDSTSGISLEVCFQPATGQRAVTSTCPAIPLAAPKLDVRARYFAVLTALCCDALAHYPGASVPTSSLIAGRLGISPRAVDAHVDYLIEKFDIPAPAQRDTGWKRRALMAYVQNHRDVARLLQRSRSGPGPGGGSGPARRSPAPRTRGRQ
ncbi:MAG: hypothetical protein ABIQ09_02815 [Jatrophihabitantaceae bacterium]